ncbi:centrosomal protein of 19 kDa-like [Lytechinus variegatus]|uniref:centrosomal protein of 19 kDa-like n=1 Tax=Lytechinus variegatus TaxID=7654 RepID=UPI001BB2A491|nr:centrosomal protein of 19 kDa-like [Lytechinus variegatus]
MALVPKKCGIRVDPPTLIVTYIDERSGKKRQRSLPLRKFTKQSNVDDAIQDLKFKPKHRELIEQINRRQLEKLLRVIQERQDGRRLDDAIKKVEKEMEIVIDPNENLNTLDDRALSEKKAIMDETFEKNRKKPGDPGFQYEVEIDFEKEGPPIESSGWDSEEDSDPLF